MSCMSCVVTMNVVLCFLLTSSMKSLSLSFAMTSSPIVGSSKNTSGGWCSSAFMSSHLILSPSDSSLTGDFVISSASRSLIIVLSLFVNAGSGMPYRSLFM